MSARDALRDATHSNGPGHVPIERVEPRTLADVLATFDRWLYLPDQGVVLAVLGAVAANLLEGDPEWLVVVGPPGSGKSETLQATVGLPNVHPAATLTEPALLSGTSRKEHAAEARGGLLRTVGDFGLILCKDFGSVLNMQRDSRAGVLAALREIYDGSWTRHVGTDGGKTLTWQGKVGLLAGCTQTIDRHHAVMGAMGERFVLYRLPGTDADEQARSALAHDGQEAAMRAELASAVAGLFRNGPPAPAPSLADADTARLVKLATLAVRCRSAVERDGYSREVELIPDAENPTRLVKVLARMLAGLHAIGVEPATVWTVVTKCALDSIPALRLAAINHLHAAGEQSTTQIADAVRHPTQTTRRALEDLAAHGVLHRESAGQGKAHTWRNADWATERYTAALTVPEMSGADTASTVPEMSGIPITNTHTRVGRHFGNGPRNPNGGGANAAFSTATRTSEKDNEPVACERHPGHEWRIPGGTWQCGICHPPAREDVEWRQSA